MGCSGSKQLQISQFLSDREVAEMTALGLTSKDTSTLLKHYDAIDLIKKKKITFEDFGLYCNIVDMNGIGSVFNQMERGNSAHITSREFLLCLWSFLRKTPHDLANFVYHSYVPKRLHIPFMSYEQLEEIVIAADGPNGTENKMKMLLERMYGDSKVKEISQNKFVEVTHSTPSLIRPATQLQSKIRAKIGGVKYWVNKQAMPQQDLLLDAIFTRKSPMRKSLDKEVADEVKKALSSEHSHSRGKSPRHHVIDPIASKSRRGSVQLTNDSVKVQRTRRSPAAPQTAAGADHVAVSSIYQFKHTSNSPLGKSSLKNNIRS